MSNPVVDVVLPCLDEEGALPWVLGRLPEGWHAIVVDNGSTDDSARVAAAHGATVVQEARRGFGSELITRALPYQLKAKTRLEFGDDGVHCRIVLPLGSAPAQKQQQQQQRTA